MSDPGPVVDVVISLYNKAPLVDRAIGSVLGQTEARWRLVVVDDGSTDGWTLDPAYADERIGVVRQANAGPGAARNRGAREGSAPLIAFLDADDEWEPDYLRVLAAALTADPTLGAASSSWSGDRSVTDLDGAPARRTVPEGRWALSPDTAPEAFKDRVDSIHSSATMVRRPVFDRFGGFYENRCTYGEDSFLWAAVALTTPVYRTAQKLLRFHVDGSTLSVGRGAAYPLPPLLFDWQAFRERVGDAWYPFMPRYLAYYARKLLARSVQQGARRQVRDFLRSRALEQMGVDRRTIRDIRIVLVKTRLRTLAKG
jgi:glycosyltransferase involved in cell wall biosynthesis